MQGNELDSMIEKVLRDQIDGQEIDAGVKDRVKNRLGLGHEENKHTKSFLIPITAAVLLIGILLSGAIILTGPANAIHIKVLERLHYFTGDKQYHVSEDIGQETNETPDYSSEGNNNLNIKEAMQQLPFLLQTPNYLPPGLELTKVDISGGKTKQITFYYIGTSKGLIISAIGNIESGGTTLAYDSDDAEIKEIDLNGQKGLLLINESGMNTVKWQDQGIIYKIKGDFSPNELESIAKSFSYREPQ